MQIERRTFVDDRYRNPVTLTVIDGNEPYVASVYIAPSDRPDVACETGGDDFTRCTREDLREWAQAILTALDET